MAKILLVEDDNNLREIYEARMLAEGYTVVTASDGEAALAVAAKEKPDLIISDVMMPKISGFEMLDILRNTEGLKTTKVIMLTALGQAEDKTRADSLGADKYLVKSQVTLEDIVNTARGLLTEEGAAGTTPEAAAPTAQQTPATPAPVGTPTPQPMAVATPPATEPAATSAPQPTTPPSAAPTTPAPTPPQPTPAPVIPVAAPPTQAATPVTPTVQPATAPTPQTNPSVAPNLAAASTAPASAAEPVPPATLQPAVPTPPATPVVTPVTSPQPVASPAPVTDQTSAAPVAPAPAAPTPTPPPADAAAIDDKVVSNAVEQLLANADQELAGANQPKTPVPATPAVPVASETPAPTPVDNAEGRPARSMPPEPVTSIQGDRVEVAGKKIIAPISKPDTKPTLDELLQKENAGAASQAAPAAIDSTPAFTPPQPGVSVTPQPRDGFDPNSISL